jgi:cobalt-zinc-cadmium efflux system membrane fusion protein
MRSAVSIGGLVLITVLALLILEGCSKAQGDPTAGQPPVTKIVPFAGVNIFSVEHPEQFPLAPATEHPASSELVVTGTVTPDISRSVPVISLASGRVVAIEARLGDTVKAGQLLLKIRSDDVAGGFSNYRKAVRDEALARAQVERARDLYKHGAMALSDLEVAEDTEDKAKIDVETTEEHLRVLGNDPNKPNGVVDIVAPASGVITDQEVTNAAGVQALGTAPFTISDLSKVWIVCDVYENDLASVRMGDTAEIRLNAYPGLVLRGRVGNIGAVLDPQIRSAKVRIEVRNPGIMRFGLFVTATFRGQKTEMHTVVPSSAILHMHDRDFVFEPEPGNKFHRFEVVSGDTLAGDMQEIKSGLKPGDRVVTNALVLDHAITQ